MEENQLEAFSNGVLAIIITIMVLELIVASNGCRQTDTSKSGRSYLNTLRCFLARWLVSR
jgi:uncharacterized membrane protein